MLKELAKAGKGKDKAREREQEQEEWASLLLGWPSLALVPTLLLFLLRPRVTHIGMFPVSLGTDGFRYSYTL